MEKLLHERLREWAAKELTGTDLGEKIGCLGEGMNPIWNHLADEIERYYIPRPRFEDGEPVKKGSKTDVCDVWSFDISSDGYWRLYDDDGVEFDYGEDGEFVKRPTPKVLDADGVEINVGDYGYGLIEVFDDRDDMLNVERINANAIEVSRANGGAKPVWIDRTEFTHERPVFDADGVRIKKGDKVWFADGRYDCARFVVRGLGTGVGVESAKAGKWFGCNSGKVKPQDLTHEKPVLDANKEVIKVGDTVYDIEEGDKYTVKEALGHTGKVFFEDGGYMSACCLSHHEPDTLGRIEDDATLEPICYYHKYIDEDSGNTTDADIIEAMVHDLLRRQREVLR